MIDRRFFLQRSFLALGGSTLPKILSGEEMGEWDPFSAPPEKYRLYWQKILFSSSVLKKRIDALSLRLEKGERSPRLLDALIFLLYAYWRSFEGREDRSRVAQLLFRVGKKLSEVAPDLPHGFMAQTIALGLEAISAGILNALQIIPLYQRNLKKAMELNPRYHWGLPITLTAALYTKTPPFPVSVGNLSEAEKYYQEGGKIARGKSALWYLFYAEYLYIVKNEIREVHRLREQMKKEMDPPDAYEYYIYDLSEGDFKNLIQVIEEGRYDRYLYSPLLPRGTPGGV
jgi:hypothetical protein